MAAAFAFWPVLCAGTLFAADILAGSGEQFLREGEEASLSPDGSRLLFQQRRNGSCDIGILRLDSKEVEWVSEGPGDAIHPAWGPGGSVVYSFNFVTNTAFEAEKNGVTDGWNLCRWQDGRTVRLTRGHCRDYTPFVSSDGKDVYFTSTRAEPANAVCSNRAQMFCVPLDGGHEPELVWGPANLLTSAAVSPRVSSDGRLLVWAQTDDIYDTWRIRAARAAAPGLSVPLTPKDMYAYSPALSANGRYLVFSGVTADYPEWGVWVMDPVRGKMLRVADGTNPSFAPDGRSVVYDRSGKIWRKELSDPSLPKVKVSADESAGLAPERRLFRFESPANGSNLPLPAEAEVGNDDFWIRMRLVMDRPKKGLRWLLKLRYDGNDQAMQLYFSDGSKPIFASRTVNDFHAPLFGGQELPEGRECELIGFRQGDRLYLSVDGSVPEMVLVAGGTLCYRKPQVAILGREFEGRILLVEGGTGWPTGLPRPPTAVELFAKEGGR